jgi:hypothetical protein
MKNTHIVSAKAHLPPTVRAFTWVRNHHFIELEDEHGNKSKMLAGGILAGECIECKAAVLALQHSGAMRCTHCSGAVKWQWSKPQLAFIPEHESEFFGVDAHLNAKGK